MSATPSPPPPIDVEALLTSLHAVAATYQARALGCKHLVEAARQKQMGLLAADAAKEAAVYEDVVTRIYGQIDAVRAEVKSRAKGGAAATPSLLFKGVLDIERRRILDLAVNAKAPPLDRYSAFVKLSTQNISAIVFSTADTAALADAYHAVWDALPDFPQVVAAFEAAGVRGADWVSKCEDTREAAVRSVGVDVDADVNRRVKLHLDDVAGLETYLRSLPQHGGQSQQMAEEALRQLARLRDDCAIRVWLTKLKQGEVK